MPDLIIPTEAETAKVEDVLMEFRALAAYRDAGFASHFEEVAELIMPSHKNTFMFGNVNTPGIKKTDRQVDATGMMANSRFSAICDSLLTPRNMFWHAIEADDDYVMKDRATKIWFESTKRKLFKYRYAPSANFATQNNAVFQSLGGFGNGPMFIDEFDGPGGVFRYKAVPLGEVYFRENHQGIIDGFCRVIRLKAYQAKKRWPDRFPEIMQKALDKKSMQDFVFIHCVRPNDEYEGDAIGPRGMQFSSCIVSMEAKLVMEERGYYSFPLAVSRYEQAPGEVYGRGPAMMVLPALKTLNAQKRVFLKQGHRAADPVLLTHDDGLMSFDLRPGALNKGGMSSDGKRLIDILPTGDIQISKEMMQEERVLINDAFLVTLFQILTESPQMTATEVIERTNEKGILLAPTVGNQQSGYLGPMIDRELDILSRKGLLDPMPPRLREAQGAYTVRYTSPLSRAMRAQEASGFLRTLESVREVVAITQDPSPLDRFNFDTAVPEIADINSTPAHWMSSDDEVAAKRQARADRMKAEQDIQAGPAAAAMMKAQAAVKKGGK